MNWLTRDRFRRLQRLYDLNAGMFAGWTTANQITLARLILASAIFCFFAAGWLAAGYLTFCLAAYFDFLDGAVARHQAENPYCAKPGNNWLTRPGPSEFGKSFDPMADKIIYYGALLPLGWHALPRWMIVASLVLAAALTVVRPIKIWLRLGDARANRFGKIKMIAEFVLISALVVIPASAVKPSVVVALFSATLVLALLSLAGHFITARKKTP